MEPQFGHPRQNPCSLTLRVEGLAFLGKPLTRRVKLRRLPTFVGCVQCVARRSLAIGASSQNDLLPARTFRDILGHPRRSPRNILCFWLQIVANCCAPDFRHASYTNFGPRRIELPCQTIRADEDTFFSCCNLLHSVARTWRKPSTGIDAQLDLYCEGGRNVRGLWGNFRVFWSGGGNPQKVPRMFPGMLFLPSLLLLRP